MLNHEKQDGHGRMRAPLDVFEPRAEPARSIYLAFQAEAELRNTRSVEEWGPAESDAVYREAAKQAAIYGLRAPTMDDVTSARNYAMGAVDFAMTWIYQLSRVMTKLPA